MALCKNGKSRMKTIHQLIANAFINNPLNLPEIDHKNADRTDYSIDNLQWVTHRENMNNPISKQRILINSNTKEAVRKMIESRIINGGDTSPKRVYQFTKEGEFIEVVVAKNDTLWSLAQRYGNNQIDLRKLVYQIKELNQVSHLIQPGQLLYIPLP